jgi:dUTPase
MLESQLNSKYDKVMNLKIFIDDDDENLKNIYNEAVLKHNKKIQDYPDIIDAGFDLYAPLNKTQQLFFSPANVNKLDFKIICSAQITNTNTETNKTYNTGYYMYPRSSISKTRLRLANSVGIIDAGYRGHIMAMFDVIGNEDYEGKAYERYIQICAPSLIPIIVEIVEKIDDLGEKTARGQGGFGSTGK